MTHSSDNLLDVVQGVEYLVGNSDISNKPLVPYSDIVCDFLVALSRKLMKHKDISLYPDVMSFAFWCRRANLNILEKKYSKIGQIRLGRGIAFHITPSNVPVNFAFSLCFGLIAGNTNIVRVSSQRMPQVELICSAINKLLTNPEFIEINSRVIVVSYKRSDEVTSALSSLCDIRIIWGGDNTISNIRRFNISPRCVDLAFSDRYSIAIIDSNAIGNASSKELEKVAINFYNDSYVMDQNACSSPHILFWYGKISIKNKAKFWDAVYNAALLRYELTNIKAIDKYTKTLNQSIDDDNILQVTNLDNLVTYIELKHIENNLHKYRGMFGLFYTYEITNLDDLASVINNKFQTLAYYGLNKKQLKEFVLKNNITGIDRIVPLGMALDMNIIWDGYDVVSHLSRVVDIH